MTLVFCGRSSNIPRYLPRATRGGSLLCILIRTAPVELCDTAAIAAAVFSSSLSLGTSKTALTITLTAWQSWHRYGFVLCPASKRHNCSNHRCRMGADCRELQAL